MPLRAPRLSRIAWGLLGTAFVAAAVGAESVGGPEMPERAGDLAAGLALLAAGSVTWTRRPRAGAGPLMVLSGVAWFAGDLSSALLYAHRGPLVHLLLTYPSGRTSSRVTLLVIAAAYADGLIPGPRALGVGDARPDGRRPARRRGAPSGGRRRRAARAGAPRSRAAALLAGRSGCTALGRLLDVGTDAAPVWALYGAVIAIACGLTADLLWGRWGRAALTGFVIDLGDHHEPQALRAALARTLGDPSLELAYRIDDHAGWVDEAGRPVALPARRRRRAARGDADRRGGGPGRRARARPGRARGSPACDARSRPPPGSLSPTCGCRPRSPGAAARRGRLTAAAGGGGRRGAPPPGRAAGRRARGSARRGRRAPRAARGGSRTAKPERRCAG